MSSSRLEILNQGGLRIDGRRPYELRAVSMQLSTYSNSADGSAIFQQGLTTVTASVFGPREPTLRSNANHDRANVVIEVGVAAWAQEGGQSSRARGDKKLLELGASIRQTFEQAIMTHLYPRSEISVFVQVLGADGGILPAAINATTLALIDAGIAMSDYVSSLSVGLHLTQPLLDLSGPEERDLPHVVVAGLPGSGRVALASLETRIQMDRFEEMLVIAVEACRTLKEEMEREVKKRTGKVVERAKVVVLPPAARDSGAMTASARRSRGD